MGNHSQPKNLDSVDLFVGHTSTDVEWAKWVAWELNRAGQRCAGGTSRAIAQMKPVSSRAIAVATFGFAFPRATRRRNRLVNRSCAFHAMSHTTFGSPSRRYKCWRLIRRIP